jgi:hypothetical protein
MIGELGLLTYRSRNARRGVTLGVNRNAIQEKHDAARPRYNARSGAPDRPLPGVCRGSPSHSRDLEVPPETGARTRGVTSRTALRHAAAARQPCSPISPLRGQRHVMRPSPSGLFLLAAVTTSLAAVSTASGDVIFEDKGLYKKETWNIGKYYDDLGDPTDAPGVVTSGRDPREPSGPAVDFSRRPGSSPSPADAQRE